MKQIPYIEPKQIKNKYRPNRSLDKPKQKKQTQKLNSINTNYFSQ